MSRGCTLPVPTFFGNLCPSDISPVGMSRDVRTRTGRRRRGRGFARQDGGGNGSKVHTPLRRLVRFFLTEVHFVPYQNEERSCQTSINGQARTTPVTRAGTVSKNRHAVESHRCPRWRSETSACDDHRLASIPLKAVAHDRQPTLCSTQAESTVLESA